MGKYDDAMYSFLSDNRRFADLFNGTVFGGEEVLRADLLEGDSERYVVEKGPQDSGLGHKTTHNVIYVSGMSQTIPKTENRYRDIRKRLKNGASFAVVAIENQSTIDYTMPWRIMQYDCLEYGRQIREIGNGKDRERGGNSHGQYGDRFAASV